MMGDCRHAPCQLIVVGCLQVLHNAKCGKAGRGTAPAPGAKVVPPHALSPVAQCTSRLRPDSNSCRQPWRYGAHSTQQQACSVLPTLVLFIAIRCLLVSKQTHQALSQGPEAYDLCHTCHHAYLDVTDYWMAARGVCTAGGSHVSSEVQQVSRQHSSHRVYLDSRSFAVAGAHTLGGLDRKMQQHVFPCMHARKRWLRMDACRERWLRVDDCVPRQCPAWPCSGSRVWTRGDLSSTPARGRLWPPGSQQSSQDCPLCL